jgi:hypothetical protein
LRVIMIGHSAIDGIGYEGLQQFAESRGYTHVWDRHMSPGAGLTWMWGTSGPRDAMARAPYGPAYYALRHRAWDAISLSSSDWTDVDTSAARKYIDLAQFASPFRQMYFFEYNPTKNVPNGFQVDATGFDTLTRTAGKGVFYWDSLTLIVRRQHRDIKPVLVIPVVAAMREFNRRAALGQVPGFASAYDLYEDDAHMNGFGRYLFGCTFFATLYKEDPRGLLTTTQNSAVSADVAQQIQESVWIGVLGHPLSGVKTTLEIIAHDTLPPAFGRVRYSTGFGATRGAVTFRVSSGSLPPGLILDGTTGMLTGKPTATGSYSFTLAADDQDAGTPTAMLTRTISVASAPAPQIVTTVLDSAIINCTYSMALLSHYGADTVRWSTAASLPAGLSVRDTLGTVLQYPATGAIMGIPTQIGTYDVTLRATDGQNRTTSKQLTLRVLPRPLNGLDYEYYHCDTLHSVNSYRNLTPDKIGIHNRIYPTFREDAVDYAMHMKAWLRITTAGDYRFSVSSDFGSVMTIDGHTISNQGVDVCMWHSASETISLQPGYYRFEYDWYNRGGCGQYASWSGPGVQDGEIPITSLYLDSAGAVPVTRASESSTQMLLPSRARVFDLAGRCVGTVDYRTIRHAADHGAVGLYIFEGNNGARFRQAHIGEKTTGGTSW